MDSIGGLNVRRTIFGSTVIWFKRCSYYLRGLSPATNARRFPEGSLGVWKAVGYGTFPLCVLVAVATVGAYGANVPVDRFVLVHAVFLLSLFLSVVVHELTHLKLAYPHSWHSQALVRGLRIGLLHQPLPRCLELRSAVLGPLSGLATAIVLAGLMWLAGATQTWVVAAGAVGPVHLLSWLPGYGDGQTIIKYWRRTYA